MLFVIQQVYSMSDITLTKWQRQRWNMLDQDNIHRMKRISSPPWSPEGQRVQGLPSLCLRKYGSAELFSKIKKLSLKLNTGLLASATCECLFSSADLLFTAKRAQINSTNFENQLLLKLNKSVLYFISYISSQWAHLSIKTINVLGFFYIFQNKKSTVC